MYCTTIYYTCYNTYGEAHYLASKADVFNGLHWAAEDIARDENVSVEEVQIIGYDFGEEVELVERVTVEEIQLR